MSEYTKSLSRAYIHRTCKRATKVSGDDYVMLECPFRPVTHTVCAACREAVPLDDVEWADSGQRISDYRKELASGFTFWEKMRFALFRTAYEGALRLNLDAKGNPKSGTRPLTADADIVVKGPMPDDQAEVMRHMQVLTAALISSVPSDCQRVRCEVQMSQRGDGRLACLISHPDNLGEATTKPSARVEEAATRLVQVMNPSGGAFPGLAVTMERMNDGSWRNNVKLMESGPAGSQFPRKT
jgi:hypothetical protein